MNIEDYSCIYKVYWFIYNKHSYFTVDSKFETFLFPDEVLRYIEKDFCDIFQIIKGFKSNSIHGIIEYWKGQHRLASLEIYDNYHKQVEKTLSKKDLLDEATFVFDKASKENPIYLNFKLKI